MNTKQITLTLDSDGAGDGKITKPNNPATEKQLKYIMKLLGEVNAHTEPRMLWTLNVAEAASFIGQLLLMKETKKLVDSAFTEEVAG